MTSSLCRLFLLYVPPKHKFNFFLNISYSQFPISQYFLFTIVEQFCSSIIYSGKSLPISVSAILCRIKSHLVTLFLMLFLYLKTFPIIYMHFTLLTVISLSAEPLILLISAILTLTVCSINQ